MLRTEGFEKLAIQPEHAWAVRHLEIANCDLRPAARSGASGSLREVADRADKKVALQLIPASAIQKRILVVRKRQVMLDEDLAAPYGVETRRLIEQVKRNIERFPTDFMFQLNQG